MKKFISIFIICILLVTNTFTVFAIDNEPTLSEYQAIAQQILEEYNVSEFTNYQLISLPDMSLDEYSEYIEEIAISNATGLMFMENSIDLTFSNIGFEVSPQVNFLRKTYSENKYFNQYFKIHATYDVVTADGEGTSAWAENARDIYGFPTTLGNFVGYTFTTYSTSYSKNSDGSLKCTATGHWKCESGGVVRDMGDLVIWATFGDEYVY